MEKQKTDLLGQMQWLLTDFLASVKVQDGKPNSGGNLTQLEQLFKSKLEVGDSKYSNGASENGIVIGDAGPRVGLQNLPGDLSLFFENNGDENPFHICSTENECSLYSSVVSVVEDHQWRFVETCVQSLLLLDQLMVQPASPIQENDSVSTKVSNEKNKMHHRPNFLGAKDLKIVSGMVQLVLTYGVWPRLIPGDCFSNGAYWFLLPPVAASVLIFDIVNFILIMLYCVKI